jgi:beta-galactosidase/beta-glucuronidase
MSHRSMPAARHDSRHGYPRPLLRRETWLSLNGDWDFAADDGCRWNHPDDVAWNERIRVPYAPETEASGIGRTAFLPRCWYRTVVNSMNPDGGRVLLHFGAVDYRAVVWVNGIRVGAHQGGYTPFSCDVTLHAARGTLTIAVCAEDDPHDLAKPRGKQDWRLEPHSIWYPRTTGIWQTVWLERVPPVWVSAVSWRPSLTDWACRLGVDIDGTTEARLRLRVVLTHQDRLVADDTYALTGPELGRSIALSDPGIDDFRNELLWSPDSPTLLDARLTLMDEQDRVIDEVLSYTALREVAVSEDRFLLNGRPYTLRLVLDQGYWPESGLTAPDDDALRRDVELTRAMGFNGARKHQKIEDPRYLYWADRIGLLVWEEMPSAYRFTRQSVERVTTEWLDVLRRDHSHPCIVAWVPFNESWGVPNLPDNTAQRHYVRALYHLTRTVDSSRPVIGNDGWESVATDIIGIHDYDANPQKIAVRYASDDALPRLFRRERPGGRLLVLERPLPAPHPDQPIVLSEFGGIAYSSGAHWSWGYSRADSAEELERRYAELMRVVNGASVFAGFCYTQLTDTYQEANGLLYADRTPKFPLAAMARATRGL